MRYYPEVKDLVGKTCFNVYHEKEKYDNEAIIFKTEDRTYALGHQQNCCEHVFLEEIHGDLHDLVGVPILVAEERKLDLPQKSREEGFGDDSFEWTFYEFRTIKGSVTLRWYGESNGYYSTSCDFREV